MNPITKKAYKAEFETTNLTIEEIITKYNIDKESLGSTETWEKRATVQIKKLDSFKPVIVPDLAPNTSLETNRLDEGEDILEEIQSIKRLALSSTREFFEGFDIDEITTKEFKDMVGVLKDIEVGELARQGKGNSGPTINILVQSLTENFKDDC